MEQSERFGRVFSLRLKSGAEVWPVRMTDRDTGQTAFRLSPAGNTKQDSVEVASEAKMEHLAFDKGYRVRCESRDGRVHGLYSPTNGRNVVEVKRHRHSD